MGAVAKCYDQYCPMAHALDLVGERWSLLIVRELLEDDQLRYSDLHTRLPGCGTNILAARLKTLEQGGVVRRRKLDPPAGSWVYELTEYGSGLREVLHVLALDVRGHVLDGVAVLDLLVRQIHGSGDVVLDSVREFCRKRGIRFEPGPWRYPGGLV